MGGCGRDLTRDDHVDESACKSYKMVGVVVETLVYSESGVGRAAKADKGSSLAHIESRKRSLHSLRTKSIAVSTEKSVGVVED